MPATPATTTIATTIAIQSRIRPTARRPERDGGSGNRYRVIGVRAAGGSTEWPFPSRVVPRPIPRFRVVRKRVFRLIGRPGGGVGVGPGYPSRSEVLVAHPARA